ncbi:SLATT domain-containing protein [Novosphingobium terrae]|uniref:SLATT domain-containing protein n=1 Tax=Novosphingobium terrae TaxID=2726189 RepID=UPI001982005E|nr:SLATT domain-containing protein [Novosphingobium terrae]
MADFTELEGQLRECFGRVVYTHKTHEKMADRCAATLRFYKMAQIVTSVVSAGSASLAVMLDADAIKVLTAVAAIGSSGISIYMKSFDPGATAQKHRDAAASIWPIRESYLSLLTDLRMQRIDSDAAVKRRDELQAKLAAIYKGAPQTDGKAYAEAQKALKVYEDYTFSDAEIDAFLPAQLKKGQKNP